MFVEKILEVNGRKETIVTWRRENERDERIQEMPRDTSNDQETYELQLNKCRIIVSKRVIESSQLWLDIVDFTDPKDDSPIPVPSFITKQMILDLVEMVEKGDMKCHHLGKLVKYSFKCCTFSWKCF